MRKIITPSRRSFRAHRDSTLPAISTARRRRPQLIADAVIASYIHDISVRHRPRRDATAPIAARA